MAPEYQRNVSKRTAHNEELPFFKVPGELRRCIYELCLVEKDTVNINSTDRFGQEPPLIQTCRKIRAESVKIYYRRNDFEITIRDYDISPYVSFLQLQFNYGFPGSLSIEYVGKPNWENLTQWLQLVYKRHCVLPPPRAKQPSNINDKVIDALFAQVDLAPHVPWSVVYKLICPQRRVLAFADFRWNLPESPPLKDLCLPQAALNRRSV